MEIQETPIQLFQCLFKLQAQHIVAPRREPPMMCSELPNARSESGGITVLAFDQE